MTHLLLRETGMGVAPAGMDGATGATQERASAAGRLELALVTDRTGLEALESEWNALFAAAGGPSQVFQTFNWCWHWCCSYIAKERAGPELAVVTGRLGGRLVLVLPLAVNRSAGLRELVWLGEPVSQYGDLLATPEAANAESLVDAWRYAVTQTRADVAHLRKVRENSLAASLLRRLGAPVTATEEAPYLDLSGDRSFAGWEERRQPRARKNRKRQARRLAEVGAVCFERYAATSESARLAAHAVALKRQSLDAKGAISLALADERFAGFFVSAAGSQDRPAGVVVRSLSASGEPAALKVLVECGPATHLHIAAFDPRFEKCGAGAVLLEHVIRASIAEGRSTLDLMAPRHDYKMDFADGVVLVEDYALALSATGWLYAHGYLRLRRRMKALVEALPAPIRRALGRLAG